MKTFEEIIGLTPNGGVKSVAYYTDARGKPCDKAAAVRMEIVELDAEGKPIFRTYGTCVPEGGGAGGED